MGKKFYWMKWVFLFLIAGNLQVGCGKDEAKATEMTDVVMGTIFTQSIYGDRAEEAAQQVRDKLLSLEQEILSKRIPESEIAQINKTSQDMYRQSAQSQPQSQTTTTQSYPIMNYQITPDQSIAVINQLSQEVNNVTVELSESLTNWMEQITAISQASGGALDVTLGTVTALWDIDAWTAAEDGQHYPLPTANQVQSALQFCGYDKINLSGSTVTMPAGMELDLGAVGKGIACDIAATALSENEITGAVVSVGGSILTYGTKPDQTLWIVGIVHPRNTEQYLGRLTLQGQWCVATSGDYERYVEVDGIRYHHILDPATGYPANHGVVSVTILSKSGLVSDALSTACFVLGIEQGLELAKTYGAEALMVDEAGELYMTDHMQDYFTPSSN